MGVILERALKLVNRDHRPVVGKVRHLKNRFLICLCFGFKWLEALILKGFAIFCSGFFCCFGIAYTNFNLMFFLVVDHFFVCACSIGSTVKKEGVPFVGFVIRIFKLICCFKLFGIFAYRG